MSLCDVESAVIIAEGMGGVAYLSNISPKDPYSDYNHVYMELINYGELLYVNK